LIEHPLRCPRELLSAQQRRIARQEPQSFAIGRLAGLGLNIADHVQQPPSIAPQGDSLRGKATMLVAAIRLTLWPA
jgi:hypothetical protein